VLFIRLFLVGPGYAFRISAGELARYALRLLWKSIQYNLLVILGSLVLLVPCVIVLMILGFMAGAGAEGPAAFTLWFAVFLPLIVGLVMTLLYLVVAVRLYPTFFGTTVGQIIRFRESWRTMDGYTWRTILALIPPAIIMFVPFFVIWVMMIRHVMHSAGNPAAAIEFTSSLWWVWLVILPFSYISYGWTVGVLSQLYKDMWPAPAILDAPTHAEDD
jgi:hypothetical protein